jgi:hypothetical protein
MRQLADPLAKGKEQSVIEPWARGQGCAPRGRGA